MVNHGQAGYFRKNNWEPQAGMAVVMEWGDDTSLDMGTVHVFASTESGQILHWTFLEAVGWRGPRVVGTSVAGRSGLAATYAPRNKIPEVTVFAQGVGNGLMTNTRFANEWQHMKQIELEYVKT